MTLLKTKIDFSIFTKYGVEFFLKNEIVPIYEDGISLTLAVCEDFDILNFKHNFVKHINFKKFEKREILFLLLDIEIKISLYEKARNALKLNSENLSTASFLDSLILFSIEKRASDIHIESYENLTLFKFRIDGKLNIFFSFSIEFFKIISSYIKLICNLDMTQTRLPLDGRFSRVIENKKLSSV